MEAKFIELGIIQPPELKPPCIPDTVVAADFGSGVLRAAVGMVSIHIVPQAPSSRARRVPGTPSPPQSTPSLILAQRESDTESDEHGVLNIQKTQAVFGGGDCEPDGRPWTGTELGQCPILKM